MPTYLIHTKSGTKGPFTLRVILKGLEIGKIPPGATLEEVESGRRLKAWDLNGEQTGVPSASVTDESAHRPAGDVPLSLAEPEATSGSTSTRNFAPANHTLVRAIASPINPPGLRIGMGSIVVLGASVVAVVSLFLTWVDFGLWSASGWQQQAWLLLLGFIYPVYGVAKNNLKPAPAYISLSLMIVVLIAYQQSKDIELLGGEDVNVAGNGFYLYLVSSIAACAGVFRIEAENIRRTGLPRLPVSAVVGAFLAILFPPAGLGFSIHGAVQSRRRGRGLGLSLFGICVSTLMMGVGVYAVIDNAINRNDGHSSATQPNQDIAGNEAPEPVDDDQRRLEEIREDLRASQEQQDQAEKDRIRPLSVDEFCSWFEEDPEAAKKVAIGEMLLFEGYLYVHRYYVDGWHRAVYVAEEPIANEQVLWKLDTDHRVVSVEMDLFHDKWEMIDPDRRVLLAGRLVKPRKLDKADWQFHD